MSQQEQAAAAQGKEAKLSKAERDKLARMEEAFDKIDQLLFRLALQGLQRMSRSSAIELKALEQTAHNAGLVTIKRQLETLITYVERYLDRDPLFTMQSYMSAINRIWLLNNMARRRHAMGQTSEEMADVIGEARRSYTELKEPLLLQPLGATGWVTDTNFVGITVYFYADGKPDMIYQASNTKPCEYFGDDPKRLLNMDISDYVKFTISDVAHGAFVFERAKVSRDGRLSLHKDLKVKQAPYIGARAYEALAVKNWIELTTRLRNAEVHPALSAEPSLVFIEPAQYGKLTIDDKHALAYCELFDQNGASILLEVSLRKENNLLVDNLELMLGKKRKLLPNALFGKAWVADGRVKFFPYTGIYHSVVQPDEKSKKKQAKNIARNEIHLTLESLKYFD